LNRWNRKWVMLFVSFVAFIHVRMAMADEFRLVPSVSLREEYNDNIYLEVRNPTRDFTTTTSGGLEVYDRTERFEGTLSGRLASLLYADNAGLDHVDQFYTGNGSYQLTQGLLVRGNGGYTVDSRPDRLLLTTGLVLSSSIRHVETYGGSAEYTLGEKSALSLSYSYEQDLWNRTTIPDYTGNTAQLSFIHDLSSFLKNTKGRVTAAYNDYSFSYGSGSSSIPIESYSAMVGATTALNEKLTFSIDAGVVRTTSDVTRLQPVVVPPFTFYFLEHGTETDVVPTGFATLTYSGEKSTANLSAGYQVLPAMGSAGTTNRTSFTFNGSHRFTWELSGTFACEYYYNKSTQSGIGISNIDYQTLRIAPGFKYEFTRDLFLEGSYSFIRIYNNAANGTSFGITTNGPSHTTATRNQFMLSLTVKHRLFE
jgi:hypothetical protein